MQYWLWNPCAYPLLHVLYQLVVKASAGCVISWGGLYILQSRAQWCIHTFTYKLKTETLHPSRKSRLAHVPALFHGVCVCDGVGGSLCVLSHILWGYWEGRRCWWPELQSEANGGFLKLEFPLLFPLELGSFLSSILLSPHQGSGLLTGIGFSLRT